MHIWQPCCTQDFNAKIYFNCQFLSVKLFYDFWQLYCLRVYLRFGVMKSSLFLLTKENVKILFLWGVQTTIRRNFFTIYATCPINTSKIKRNSCLFNIKLCGRYWRFSGHLMVTIKCKVSNIWSFLGKYYNDFILFLDALFVQENLHPVLQRWLFP